MISKKIVGFGRGPMFAAEFFNLTGGAVNPAHPPNQGKIFAPVTEQGGLTHPKGRKKDKKNKPPHKFFGKG